MTLRPGASIAVPELPGKWSIWSQAADAPGAYFVLAADTEARALGLKYAVIRAIQPRSTATPTVHLIRTDPHRPELFTEEKKR